MSRPARPRRWRLVVPAGLLAAGVTLFGVAALVDGPGPGAGGSGSGTTVASDGADPSAEPSSGGSEGEDATGPELLEVQQATDVQAPVRVEVPSLGIDTRLDRLGTDSLDRLETPPQWQVAGWFAGGPSPGDAGPAVIAGHVDSPTGPAVFARLSELGEGDAVRVTDAGGTVREFAVTSTTTTPQDGFPTEAVYGPTPDPQLRLITCSGPYDAEAGGYQDNLLVFATEVDA